MLLLDAGNTLIFLDGDAIAEVAGTCGVPLDARAVLAAEAPAKREYAAWVRASADHESGWFHYMRALVRIAGAPSERADELVAALRAAHDRVNLWRRVPVGVPQALDRLRAAGTRLGVVSNSEGAVADILERVGLASRLEVVVDSGIEGVSKPDPTIFLRACARMDVVPEAAVYAGDVPEVDVEGARAAGLEAILVDAFDDHAGYDAAARVRSVVELVDGWLSV